MADKETSHLTASSASVFTGWENKVKIVIYAVLVVAYHVYFGFAISKNWNRCTSWCDGVKLLTAVTVVVYVAVSYYFVLKPTFKPYIRNSTTLRSVTHKLKQWWENKWIRWAVYCLFLVGLLTFYIVDTRHNRQRLVSLSGIVFVIITAFAFSKHRKEIRWRHLIWSLGIQFTIGLIVLRWPLGRNFFSCISNKTVQFLGYADAGSGFLFDYLSSGNISSITLYLNNSTNITDVSNGLVYNAVLETSFAFKVLPVILYFSFVISVLFYYGIMQRIVIFIGWWLQVSIGTTAAESLNAAASVFVGMSEAPLMIRPYLERLTESELHAVMAGGFATIAGTVFAAYISFGISGIYLLSGALMSAPIALGLSKVVYPETEESVTSASHIKITKGTEKNALEAAANGIMVGVTMAVGIASSLISFIAIVQFANGVVSWAGSLVDCEYISLEWLLGKLFIPLAFLMGVEWKDCNDVGLLLGIKTIVNEFVAYKRLSAIAPNLSKRSYAIATYALCSFSNIGSLGSQIGILGAIVPNRKSDIATIGFRALCTGAGACFITACVAGSLIED